MDRRCFALILAAALSGCGGQRVPPPTRHLPDAIATVPTDAALLRIVPASGTAQLLQASTLTPRAAVISSGLPAISRLLAPSSQDDQSVYAADNAGRLIEIDLRTHKVRVISNTTHQLVAAPDGTIFGVDSAHHPVRFFNRTLTTFRATVDRGAQLLRGPGDDIVVVATQPAGLQVISRTGQSRHIAIPAGFVAGTWIGDRVAVVTDSGVTLVTTVPEATGKRAVKQPARSVRVRGTPTAATFSPSGHRLYVTRRKGGLVMLDGLSGKQLNQLELQGSASAVRVDRSGRWLLVHGPEGDSLWVVDLSRWQVATSRAAPWTDDLPQVVDGHTLLVRSRGDLLAVDLQGNAQHAVLAGGGADLYMMLPWTLKLGPTTSVAVTAASAPADNAGDTTTRAVRTPAPAASTPLTGVAGEPPAPARDVAPAAPHGPATLYLQVSSSQNEDWAKALAKQLKDAGYPAKVLDPAKQDDPYRVVIGPYSTRDEADAVGKRLGRSYFIITPGAGDT